MKKLVSSVLCLCLMLTACIITAGAYTLPEGYGVSTNEGASFDSVNGDVYGYVGDVDENGTVNVKDSTLIQKVVASITSISDGANEIADVNFDGSINVKDATAIQKWIAGMTVDAPIYHVLFDDSYSQKIADYEAYKAIIESQIASIKAEGPIYRGTSSQFSQEVMALSSEISSLERQISALAWDTSNSGRAKKAILQAELNTLKAELDALYDARSRANGIAALEKELEDYYEQLFG